MHGRMKVRGKNALASLLLAGVLSGLLALGMRNRGLEAYLWLGNSAAFAPFIVCTFAALWLLTYLVFKHAPFWLVSRYSSEQSRSGTDWRLLTLNKRSILLTALVILACWLPWLACRYPVDFCRDTYLQLTQFMTDAPTYYTTQAIMLDTRFVDHHPVFDSLVFGFFLWGGVYWVHKTSGSMHTLCFRARERR